MILIGLQKAFDTIGHEILTKEMKYLGFSKNVITWFKLYLSERQFKININTSYSSPLIVNYGSCKNLSNEDFRESLLEQ